MRKAIFKSLCIVFFYIPSAQLPGCGDLSQWASSSHQVTKVLELQHQFFQWIFRVDFFKDWLVGSPCSPRDSQESSPTPQFKSINSSVLNLHYVQLSHPYMTTGETIALTRWTFVGKTTSLLFNMLSRFVIAFLPRSKYLLLSWMQSLSAVILKPPKIKSLTVVIFSHHLPWSDRTGCHGLCFLDFEF